MVILLKLLVYGAGVLGSELAHELCTGNEVTLLARGERKLFLEKNGLVIRHSLQRKITHDTVKVIEELAPDDVYDMIFVVTQFGCLKDILPLIAQNKTKRVILIGNNADPDLTVEILQKNSPVTKEIAFAFYSACGRVENGLVISGHAKSRLTIGGIDYCLDSSYQTAIQKAFSHVRFSFVWQDNMKAWLLCHLAFILPACYTCYALDGKLQKATKKQSQAILDAGYEAYQMLKSQGIPIRPVGDEEYFKPASRKRISMSAMLYIMCKTPLGRLAISDHAMHAIAEMQLLDQKYQELCAKSSVSMPVWNSLRENMVPFQELL